MISLLWFLLIGLAAGFIAGKIMRGDGFGLFGNLIIGIIGAMLGGLLFGLIGLTAYGLLGQLVTATVGAVVLLWIVSLVRKR